MADQNVTQLTNLTTLPDTAEFYVANGGNDAAVLASVMKTSFTAQAAIYAAVKAILSAGTNVTITPADSSHSLTIQASGSGGGGAALTVSGAVPIDANGANGDVHIRVSATAGDLGNITSIYSKDSGSWAELQAIVSATQNNIYTELKNILQQGTNSPIVFDDSNDQITVNDTQSSGGAGLNQTQVDARVAAGVLDWAETGNTDKIPSAKLPAGSVAGLSLTEVGSGTPGATFDQLDTITRADLSEVFFLDLTYTRTNADLRMSGFVRKADIPDDPSEYKFQVQGDGGNYVALRFSASGDTGELEMEENGSATAWTATVYNTTPAPVPAVDAGISIAFGTGVPLRQTEDWYFQDPDNGDTLVIWRNDGLTWNELSETTHVMANPSGTDGQTVTRLQIAGTNWNLPAGGGTVGGLSLSEIGDDSVSSTWAQVDDITRADLSDVFLVHATYTRTNSDLQMSGIVIKADIPDDPSEYKFQLQGSGGDYVGLRFSAAGDTADFEASEGGVPTSVNVKIFNIAGATLPTFDPTKENLYDAVKAIFQQGTNSPLAFDDTESEITVNDTQGTGGGSVNFAASKSPDTASGTDGSATTASRSDHAHSQSGLYATSGHNHSNAIARIPAASPGNNKVWKTNNSGTPAWRDEAGGSTAFADSKTADTASGVNGSASTAARSDHAHQRSNIYESSTSTRLGRIPTDPSSQNNKVWKTNNSGAAAWRDEAGGGATFTWVKPDATHDETRNSLPAQEVWRSASISNLITAVGALSGSAGDYALAYLANGSANSVKAVLFLHDGTRWSNRIDGINSSAANYRSGTIRGAGGDSEALEQAILPFALDTTFPQWTFVYSGPSLYQKQTDTSADAQQPNLADSQAWEKIWPRDIPTLIQPSYQGDSTWESVTGPITHSTLQALPDIDEVYSGHRLVVEIDADLPDALQGNTEIEIIRAAGGEVSQRHTVLNGRHFYLFDLEYTIVPDLELSPVNVEVSITGTGTARFRHLSAYHLDSSIDDESWEMYRLMLDTLEERALELASRLPYKGQWQVRGFYNIGDMVKNGSHPTLYVRLTQMTAEPTEDQPGPRGDRTNWIPISEWMGTWSPGMYLSPGNVVNRTVNGEYRLYMVTAVLHAYTTEPENSQYFKRIDREYVRWGEILDKPYVKGDRTDADGNQLIYLLGDEADSDRQATIGLAVGTSNGTVTPTERARIQGVEDGAEVNVQADWAETSASSDAFIRSKPVLPPSNANRNVQPDWDQTNASFDSFIRNKPTIPTLRSAAQTARLLETLADAARLDYEALKNKPTINSGDVNVNADWNVTDAASDSFIRNKPTIPTLRTGAETARLLEALSGNDRLSYNQLRNRLDGIGIVQLLEALTGDARLDAVAVDNLNRWAQYGRTPLDGEWVVGRQYYAGEIVGYFSHIYTANEDHTSTAENGPRGASSVWTSQLELRVETQQGPILGSVTSPSSPDDLQTLSLNGWMFNRGTYSSTSTYFAQNVVSRNGSLYIAKRQTRGNAPESSPNDWDLFWEAPASTGSGVTVTNYQLPFGNQDLHGNDPSVYWQRTTIAPGTIPEDAEVTVHWGHQYSQTPNHVVFWAGDPTRTVSADYFRDIPIPGSDDTLDRYLARDGEPITHAPIGSMHSLPISRPVVGTNLQDITHVTDNVLFAIGDNGNLCFWTSDQRPNIQGVGLATHLLMQVKVY